MFLKHYVLEKEGEIPDKNGWNLSDFLEKANVAELQE